MIVHRPSWTECEIYPHHHWMQFEPSIQDPRFVEATQIDGQIKVLQHAAGGINIRDLKMIFAGFAAHGTNILENRTCFVKVKFSFIPNAICASVTTNAHHFFSLARTDVREIPLKRPHAAPVWQHLARTWPLLWMFVFRVPTLRSNHMHTVPWGLAEHNKHQNLLVSLLPRPWGQAHNWGQCQRANWGSLSTDKVSTRSNDRQAQYSVQINAPRLRSRSNCYWILFSILV